MRLGDLLVRCVDALAVLPALLVVLVLAAGFPGSDAALVAAVALATAPFSTRVLRAAADTVLNTGYVEAAVARGDTRRAVLRHDVLPNIAGPALMDTALRLVASCTSPPPRASSASGRGSGARLGAHGERERPGGDTSRHAVPRSGAVARTAVRLRRSAGRTAGGHGGTGAA